MSHHPDPPAPHRLSRVAIATVSTVGIVGLVVAVLAVFQPSITAPAAQAPRPSSSLALTPTPPAGQEIHAASVLEPAPTRAARKRAPQAPQGVGGAVQQLRSKSEAVAQAPTTVFRVSSFNLLGDSHTRPGGNRKGWASSVTRTGWAVDLLDAYRVDVVGFQEIEKIQVRTFESETGGAWGIYPGVNGHPNNSIAWRHDTWQLVRGSTVPVPYFRGRMVNMPYVLLRNVESGREVYFINVHNPADAHGPAQHWRDRATAIESNLIEQLHAQGYPVILTGDFNDRAQAFCAITGAGTMRAANGGSSGGTCVPPERMNVDWIFGSASIGFTNFVADKSGLVTRTTDHPIIVADAIIAPQAGAAARSTGR